MKYSVKSILTALVWAAALCVPAYIAAANYFIIQNSPMDVERVDILEITDIDGTLYSLSTSDEDARETIEDFLAINERAVKQTSLPEPLVGENYYEFNFFDYIGGAQTYRYYFTREPSEAYFVDPDGDAYHITESDATAFLATSYARCLYNTTSFPTMTVSGEKIAPNSADWAYEIYGGEYVTLDDIPTAPSTEKVYRMKGAFAVSFDDEPDFMSVEVYDDGTLIYNDLYDNIANASLEGKTIDVVLSAKWYANDESTCYGEANYRFKAKILLPAVFYLGETTIDPGEFVVITAKNVEDPSAVEFASEPDIGYTPTFFTDGDVARALLPISADYTGGDVKLTLSYGEVSQEMTLGVNEKTFRNLSYDISYTKISQTRTETTLNAFAETLAEVVKTTSSTPLWSGTFSQGISDDLLAKKWAYIRTGYGHLRTLTATGETYRHEGIDYAAGRGESVLAVNGGTVAYTGYLELTGYTVIIDHGLGLKSLYAHMDSSSVNVGDIVEKNSVIGTIGSTGFTNSVLLHVGTYVFDVPVCSYDLWEYGVIMTE